MKKTLIIFLIICIAVMPLLMGCGDSTPVETFVLSPQQLTDQNSIEKAAKTEQNELSAGSNIFANVSLIESPKGMKYTINWLLNGQQVKTEDKATATEPRCILTYTLEKEKLHAGDLKVQILYKDTVLAEKDVTVK